MTTPLADLLRTWPEAVESLYRPEDWTADDLARLLVALRDARAQLATFADRVEADLLAAMTDKTLDVPGIGLIEAKRATRRTAWEHETLIPAIVARVADEPGVFFDPDDGTILPYATIGHNIARRLRECVSFGAGKVTGLRAIGIQPDEYCREEEGRWSVKLPTREL